MIYCPNCGTQTTNTAQFCSNCGSKMLYDLSTNELQYRYAPNEKRFIAFVIDRMVMALLTSPTIFCFIDGLRDYSFWSGSSSEIDQELLIGILLLIVPTTYYFIKDGLFNGASIGKKMMHLQTINQYNNSPCSLANSVVRNIVFFIIMLFLPIIPQIINGFVLVFSKQHRSLGDIIANTIVVEDESKKDDLNHQ